MLSNYFHAEARVAVANGLKFVAINNIPLEKNRRSSFNVLSKRPNSSRTWMRNFPLTSWRGAVAARRPRRTSSCSPMRRRNVPRSISRSLARLRGINAMAFQGLSYRRPLAPHRHYHRSQVAPARGNLSERVGPSWRCGPRYSARSTVEATRKADEHRPGKIIWPKFGAGSNIESPGVLPL
jgi:hypothetical protein